MSTTTSVPAPAINLARRQDLFSSDIVITALKQSVLMLRPDVQWKNPVMFVVEIGAALTLLYVIQIALGNVSSAASLRKTRVATPAFRLRANGSTEKISSIDLRPGDVVAIEASQVIPGDGDVIEGGAIVNEAAITGESAPVIREAGGDRSGVTGGTTVLSDRIIVRISAGPGESFLDKMIALVEGARRQRTPNEIALTLVLTAFTLIFMIVVVPLWPMAFNAEQYMTGYLGLSDPLKGLGTDVPTLVALIVCLIPTTIGALLAAIGIAGMDRALRATIIAKSGKAVEVAGDIDTVMLDKTGTITLGDRQAREFVPLGGTSRAELMRLAALASVSDQTPEGRSIVAAYTAAEKTTVNAPKETEFVPFTAQSRMSGVNLPNGAQIRKGAPDAIVRYVQSMRGVIPSDLDGIVAKIGSRGATPLVVASNNTVAGVIALEDILEPGINKRMAQLRLMGLRTVMITGDNALTAQAIARQAGVDDFIAEATPEKKLAYLRSEQAQGKLVAMMGDGTNDAPSLAQADVGLAMNSGTQAAKEAGNMVDLDSDPTKLIEVVAIGKQLLMTRGALTTFSIANDVAKYFAIVPAMFAGTLPWLKTLDVMHLHSPTSAIVSAVIFNALIIPVLIPIALKGVRYEPLGADALLRRNLLIWGLGGVIVPFIGIKAIDVVMVAFHLVA